MPGGIAVKVADTDSGGSSVRETSPETAASSEVASEPPGEQDAETLLLSAGVVEPCHHEDDRCLGEKFDSAWED